MRRLVAAVLVLFLVASVSHAGGITLSNSDLATLGGGSAAACGPAMKTVMLNGTVTSQAYLGYDNNDMYIYLYQIENTGPTAIELFTLWPFGGADNSTDIGWLADLDGVGTGFVDGDQDPEDEGYISGDEVISFYYTQRAGYAIADEEHSAVMYVVSDRGPALVNGNLIGGQTGSGKVVGVVPEPATAIYLLLGGLTLLGFYRRR